MIKHQSSTNWRKSTKDEWRIIISIREI